MKKLTIPSLTEANPRHGIEAAKLSELKTKQSQVDAELAQIRSTLSLGLVAEAKAAQTRGVAELLGETFEGHGEAERERYKTLSKLSADLRIAIGIQEQRLAVEKNKANREVCKQVAGTHKKLVTDVTDKMIAVLDATNEYRAFKDALETQDIGYSQLNVIPLRFVDSLAMVLNDAANSGHIAKSAVPASIRQ